jgi:plastocyanin
MRWRPATARKHAAGLAACAVLFLAAASGAAPAARAGAVGTVSGMVRLRASSGDRPPALSPYSRSRYRPPARAQVSSSSPENVVVYLRPSDRVTGGARTPAVISQQNRTIIPHVTIVQTGSRIDFPNEDDVFHNIFSLSGPKRFNLGRYPPGESRSEQFDRAGVVRLFCDIHSEMGGVIVVVDTPYFTRPDADGRFRIPNVAEGEYMAIVWHEVAGTDSTRVVVTPGGDARVDFDLGG